MKATSKWKCRHHTTTTHSIRRRTIDINKPINLSKEDWDDISASLQKVFYRSIYSDLDRNNIDEIYQIVSTNKCAYRLNEEYTDLYFKIATPIYEEKLTEKIRWMQYPLQYVTPEKLNYTKNCKQIKELAYSIHYETVAKNLRNARSPLKFIEDTDWSVFDEKDYDELRKRAYQKEILNLFPRFDLKGAEDFLNKEAPAWVEESDLKLIKTIAEDIVKLNKSIKTNTKMLELLEKVAHYLPLGNEKPDILNDDEWQRLQVLESDIVKAKRVINITSRRNEINNRRVNDIKNKLLQQLRTINEVLNDPTAANRIEQYDNVFAPGNYENLKKIAYLLSSNETIKA